VQVAAQRSPRPNAGEVSTSACAGHAFVPGVRSVKQTPLRLHERIDAAQAGRQCGKRRSRKRDRSTVVPLQTLWKKAVGKSGEQGEGRQPEQKAV